jgi:hypothetical protein
MTGFVWTMNAIAFFALFVVWNRHDFLNFSIKFMLFAGAFVNGAPAFNWLMEIAKH